MPMTGVESATPSEAEGMQQIGAAGFLAFEIFRRVVRGKVVVGGRIPERIVDAVEDAAQTGRTLVQDALKLLAEFRRLNFLRIPAAHRGEEVRENDAAFEKVEVVVFLQFVHGENVPWKKQLLSGAGRKLALEGGVVNGQDRRGAAQQRVGRVSGFEIDGNERRLPVVYVKNLRDADGLRGLNHRPAKEAESLSIVRIVSALGAIKFLPIKEFWRFDKVVLHAIAQAAINDSDKTVVIAEGDSERADDIFWIVLNELAHARVERNVDGNLVTEPDQLTRQRADHVGQPAGLGEGRALRSCESNLHLSSSAKRAPKGKVYTAAAAGPDRRQASLRIWILLLDCGFFRGRIRRTGSILV